MTTKQILCYQETIHVIWKCSYYYFKFSSVQLLSRVWLFATPWTEVRQASLSITNSWSLLRLMSIESVMPSNHFILCRLLLLLPSIFPSIRVFSNESVLCIRWPQSIGVSASASVLPKNIQDWFPVGWTDWVFLQSKGLSRVFSNTTVQKHLEHSTFFRVQLLHPHMTPWKTIALTRWTFVGIVMYFKSHRVIYIFPSLHKWKHQVSFKWTYFTSVVYSTVITQNNNFYPLISV